MLFVVPVVRGHGQFFCRAQALLDVIHDGAHGRGDRLDEVVGLLLLAPPVQRVLAALVGICVVDLRAALQLVPAELDKVRLAGQRVLPEGLAQVLREEVWVVAAADEPTIGLAERHVPAPLWVCVTLLRSRVAA